MNLNVLRTFVAVMDLGSFSEAGRLLGYTQSAVSQQISSLERSLGLHLFERRARTIQPTEAARYLYVRSGELTVMAARLEQDLARLSAGQAGQIRVGFFLSAGPDLLPRVLARFMVRRRDVQVALYEGEPDDVLMKTLRGELDVALVFRYDGIPERWPAELRVITLMTDPMQVIASCNHRFAGRDVIRLEDLTDEPWISTSVESDGHKLLVRTTGHAGFAPNLILTINDFDTVQGLVQASLGVAMIPRLAHGVKPGVITLPIKGLPQRHIAAVTRPIEPSPLVRALILSVRDVAAEISAQAAVPS